MSENVIEAAAVFILPLITPLLDAYTPCLTCPYWLSLYLVVLFGLCLSIYRKIIFPIVIDYLDVDVANFEDVAFPFSIEVGL